MEVYDKHYLELSSHASVLEHVSRPIYIHFLDRELLTCLGAYASLSEALVYEDLRLVLLSTYEPTYVSVSLVFENRFARTIFWQLLPLFQRGHIEIAMKENSLRDFILSKREQYSHAKEIYPFYFDDTWKHIAKYGPTYRHKELDTTTVIKGTLVSDLQGYGAVSSAKRLGVEADQREIVRLTPYTIEALEMRGKRAITRLLFMEPYERLGVSFTTRRSFDIKISENYVNAYLSEYDGTIVTGLSSGIEYFRYLCPTFPFHHIPLWRQLNQRLGCLGTMRTLNAEDIVSLRETPQFQNFVDEFRFLIARAIQARYSRNVGGSPHRLSIIEYLERVLRANLYPISGDSVGVDGYLRTLEQATTALRSLDPDKLLRPTQPRSAYQERKIPEQRAILTVPAKSVSPALAENVMKVDIGIITVRDDELQAVLQRFRTKRHHIPGGRSYYIGRVTAKGGQHYTIAITRCAEQGNDLSQKLARDMILDLEPQIILVVGIAGGVPDDEFTLGDVIVSTQILNFNVDALKSSGATYVTRGSSHPLIQNIAGLLPGDRALLDWNKQSSIGLERPTVHLQQIKFEGGDDLWWQKVQKSLDWHFGREQNQHRPPLFKTGHIASSNHLARDPSVVSQWLTMNRAILATEMESAGVCEAANDINYHYPVMAIRGISDIIGLERDRQWAAYACHTAAAFAKAFIKAGIIDSGNLSPQPTKRLRKTEGGNSAVYQVGNTDWGEAPDVPVFFGRKKELATLEQWIIRDRCRLVAIVGMRGIGKTRLSAKLGRGGIGKTDLTLQLARGIEDQFEYIIWRRLLSAPKASNILTELIKFLSDQQDISLPDTVDDQISRFIHHLRQKRCLVILDNVEAILQGGEHAGHYRESYEEYGRLFRQVAESAHQSCLLLNSRETPLEISELETKSGPVHSLQLRGLNYSDGKRIFGERGSYWGSDEDWKKLNTYYNGNPLALELAALHIKVVFSGNISRFLKEGKQVFANLRDLLDWYFQRLSDTQKEVMYWLAINREPVTLGELKEDLLSPVAKQEVSNTLQSLQQMIPLEKSSDRFTLQPVFTEFLTDRLVECLVEEVKNGKISFLNTHALLKAVARDYIRESQSRIILQPVIQFLTATLGKTGCEESLKRLLNLLHKTPTLQTGYAAGNILNLLIYLNADLRGSNFSQLNIRQAYLQGVYLPNVNFSNAYLEKCLFTETFGNVLSVVYSPDGTLLAAGVGSGAGDGEIWIIRISDSKLLQICKGHVGWVWSVAFSPDGKTIASGGNDGTVRLWSTDTGTAGKVMKEHSGIVRAVAFSPDGRILASGGEDRTVRLWSTNTGQCLKVSSPHKGRIWSVAFSSDGEIFASGSDDGMVRLWQSETEIDQPFRTLLQPMNSKVWAVAFSPKENVLASGSEDAIVRLWNADSGECIREMEGHTGWVRALNFSPDGSMLASSGEEPLINLWDTETGHPRRLEGHSGWVRTVRFSPDGQTLASGSDDLSMRLWDVSTGSQLKKWQGYGDAIRSVAFSPDGEFLVSGGDDQMVRLWNTENGQSNILYAHTGQVWSVSFSPDGEFLASGGDDQMVRLWNIKTSQRLKPLRGHNNSVRSVVFNPTQALLASGSLDKTVDLWDLNTQQYEQIPNLPTDRVRSVAFSPNGVLLVSGGDDEIVRLWNVKTGEVKQLSGHRGRVQTVAFSPAGRILATAGNDGKIRLWDAERGECLSVLEEHAKTIWSVAFSQNGKLLASGSDDKTIRLWDIGTGKRLLVLDHPDIVLSVTFSPYPGESILASGSDHGAVTLWDVQTGARLGTFKIDKPYKGMNIADVKGLTEDQKTALRALGAIEDRQPERV